MSGSVVASPSRPALGAAARTPLTCTSRLSEVPLLWYLPAIYLILLARSFRLLSLSSQLHHFSFELTSLSPSALIVSTLPLRALIVSFGMLRSGWYNRRLL